MPIALLLLALLSLASPAYAQKISTLPSATTPLTGSELIALVQGGATKKAAVSALIASSTVTSVTGTAGEITVTPTTGDVIVSLPSTITQGTAFSGALAATSTFSASGGGALAGTFTGSPTLSGASITLSGAATGTQNRCLGLTAGGVLATSAGACGAGSGNVTAAGTLTSNQIVLGGGTTAVATLGSLGTTTTLLHGNAAGAPTFGAVSLTADVSGALPAVNGGTGLTFGTSGGIPYYSSPTAMLASGVLTANLPVIGGGAGTAPAVGTRSGNTTAFVTTTGTQTSGDCVKIDASGNHIANGSACGSSVSVTAGTANIVVTPSPGTGTFTVGTTEAGRDISGSGVAIVTADNTKTVLLGAFTYTLAQAGTAGFLTGWGTCLLNVGAASATVTSTTSVFKAAGGTTSLSIPAGSFACPSSDGTDYVTTSGRGLKTPAAFATGTTHTFVAPTEMWECTGTCTVTPPTPAAGYQFCVRNANAVTSVITLAAVSSVLYEKTDFTAYGTVNTAATSGGALGDKICIVGKDSTHYDVLSFNGTWTVP